MSAARRWAAVMILSAGIAAGCAGGKRPAAPPPGPRPAPPPPEAVSASSENPLYFYLESQLQQKRGNLSSAIDYLQQAIERDPDSTFLLRELALLFLQQKDTASALETVTRIIEKDPRAVEAYVIYGRIKQRQKQLDAARQAYEKVIAEDPQRENIYLLLGGLYMEGQDLENARRVYLQLVENFPAAYAGYFFLGRIAAFRGEFEVAEDRFRKTLNLRPDLEEPRNAMLDLYRMHAPEYLSVAPESGDTLPGLALRIYGRTDETILDGVAAANPGLPAGGALDEGTAVRFPPLGWDRPFAMNERRQREIIGLYQEYLETHPRSVRAALGLALFYIEQEQPADARPILTELGRRSITEREVTRTVVQEYLEKNKYPAAVALLEGLLKGAPDSSEIHYVLGLAYDGRQQAEAAVASFGRVAHDSEFFQHAAIHISFLLQQQGKTQAAIDYLLAVMEEQSENPEYPLYLGSLYEETEAYDLAEEVLLRGLELDPENARLHFRLGVVYDKSGRKEASIAAMKRVIEIDPRHASALNYLGYTYADLGRNLDEAERYIQEALKHMPDDGYITDSLGWVYYKKGLYRKALDLLVRAARLVPGDPIIMEHVGDVYRELGEKDKALDYYRRSLENDAKDRQAIEEKIRLLTDPQD